MDGQGAGKTKNAEAERRPAALGPTPHAAGERFIPVPRDALMERLWRADVWPGVDQAEVKTFFRYLVHWRHLSYADRQNAIVAAYFPFNPDRDEVEGVELSAEQLGHKKADFIALLRALLERANYDEIPRERLAQIFSEQNPYGLEFDVDLGEFDEVLVYTRGLTHEVVTPDLLQRTLTRKKPIELAKFQRLFVMLQLKSVDARVAELVRSGMSEARARKQVLKQRRMLPEGVGSESLHLKLFKKIPRADLEMLFPNTKVKMRSTDKLTLGVTAGGGVGMGVFSTATKLVAAAMSPIGIGMAILGLFGVAGQQFARLMALRSKYMLQVAQSLYFQNLANNHGVLALLAERGEEEDCKEELLLYTACALSQVRRADLGEVKTGIERFLAGEFGVAVTFDVNDALERLLADGLIVEEPDGNLRALPPREAALHIDAMWDVYLDKIGHSEQAMARSLA